MQMVAAPILSIAPNCDVPVGFQMMQRDIYGFDVQPKELRDPALTHSHRRPLKRVPRQHSVYAAGSDRKIMIEENGLGKTSVLFGVALFGFSVHFLFGFSVHVI